MRHTWTLISAILTVTLFANANDTDSIDCEISLQQIIENGTSCIREIQVNKIYLKNDCIFMSEKGAYALLNDSGDYAYIPELCTDADGCFIQVSLISKNAYQASDYARNYQRTCPGCGWRYFTTCQNPDCPLKKKKR